MRRLLMLVVMALAALAVSASSAFAMNTDFPYKSYPNAPLGDREADNWTAVHVDDAVYGGECVGPCVFDTGSSNAWGWSAPVGGQTYYGNCTGGIEGEVNASGDVEVTGVTQGGGQWGVFGDGLCINYEPVDLEEWTGLACHHVPSGEVWLRQNVVMDHNNGGQRKSGESYGKIVADANGESQTLEFRNQVNSWEHVDLAFLDGSGANTGWKHNAAFPFTGMAFTAAEGPCGWSELS
jgi:hypothetical protein